MNRRDFIAGASGLLLPSVAQATPIIGFSRAFNIPLILTGAIVSNTADSGSTNFNDVALTWNNNVLDPNGMHSTVSNTSRLTVPASMNGYFLIFGGFAYLTSVATSSSYRGYFKRSGSTFFGSAFSSYQTVTPSVEVYLGISTPAIPVATGEYYEFFIAVDDTTTVLKNTSNFACFIIGPPL